MMQAAMRGANQNIGSSWHSLSCPRTLQHADQGNRTCDLLITRRWLYRRDKAIPLASSPPANSKAVFHCVALSKIKIRHFPHRWRVKYIHLDFNAKNIQRDVLGFSQRLVQVVICRREDLCSCLSKDHLIKKVSPWVMNPQRLMTQLCSSP